LGVERLGGHGRGEVPLGEFGQAVVERVEQREGGVAGAGNRGEILEKLGSTNGNPRNR
jgi:hypothetical protein